MTSTIVPIRVYLWNVAALFVLLAATVGVNELHVGVLSLPLALAIAVAKAMLIALCFMHIRYSPPLLRLAAAVGFFWLMLMIGGTVLDVATRDWPPAHASKTPLPGMTQSGREAQ